MEYINSPILNKKTRIKLVIALALSCFFCELLQAQEMRTEPQDTSNIALKQQRILEEELMTLINQGVDSKIISEGLKDTIMQFIRSNNLLSSSKFGDFSKVAMGGSSDVLPSNKKIIMRDGIPIVVDSTLSGPNISKEKIELSLERNPQQSLDYAASRDVKNGVNKSMLLPDRLHAPEREDMGKNKFEFTSQDAMMRKMTSIDYFSKGLDGYYKKLIDMGYIGQGWEDTKAVREAIDRMRKSISENMGSNKYRTEPEFITRMNKSKNPFLNILGSLLKMLDNGAKAQIRHGYTNPNYMIVTPTPGFENRPGDPARYKK